MAMRVFVVDDEESIALVASDVLRNAGFEVYTFNDPRLAAQFARESPPDVVVTDYDMPHINGLVLAAWISVNCPACRVVIISGDAPTVAEQAPIGLDFTLLPKPISSKVLIAAVQADRRICTQPPPY
jgi:DNA-binding NtrC family response regulator